MARLASSLNKYGAIILECFGIHQPMAYTLMPWLGAFDILMGLIILVYPVRAVVAWLVIWGMVTAMLRPLSGEPFAEFIERAGNYGAPLCLLLLTGGIGNKIKHWMVPATLKETPNNSVPGALIICLRITVFLLFAGHGWLNLLEKKSLLDQYARLGLFNTLQVAQVIGLLEILAAVAVLIKPSKPLLLLLFVWKITSELMYPHYEIFEWIERGGSYGCVLALYFSMSKKIATAHAGRFAAGNKKYTLSKNTLSVFSYKLMKKIGIVFTLLFLGSCGRHGNNINDAHVKKLAENFMRQNVIPSMSNPKPFEIAGLKVIVKTAADYVNDYRFVYDHLSQDKMDSVVNKVKLDSVEIACVHPDSVISITVDVAYKTKYKRGDVVTDSIKLGYNVVKDEVGYWPF